MMRELKIFQTWIGLRSNFLGAAWGGQRRADNQNLPSLDITVKNKMR